RLSLELFSIRRLLSEILDVVNATVVLSMSSLTSVVLYFKPKLYWLKLRGCFQRWTQRKKSLKFCSESAHFSAFLILNQMFWRNVNFFKVAAIATNTSMAAILKKINALT